MIDVLGIVLISYFLLQAEIVSLEIQPNPATVGDVVECSVQIRLPPGSRSLTAYQNDPESPTVPVGGRLLSEDSSFSLWEVRLRRSFFTPGKHQWPPVRLVWLNSDGALDEMNLPPIKVKIESVLKRQPMGEMRMRDIKREAKDSIDAVGWLTLGMGIVFVIVGILLTYLSVKPHKRERRLSLEDKALLSLAEIEHSKLIDKGYVREYCSAVATLLRGYVEGRFGITTVSSSQIVKLLKGKELEDKLLKEVEGILLELDKARFSTKPPSPDSARKLAKMTGELILKLSKWQTDSTDTLPE